jgi:hypothetical protein
MTPADFRRIALSLPGAEEGSHMGAADFRVGGHIFATLAAEAKGYGNLMLDPETQQPLVEELPEIFLPVPGGWGRNGATHMVLATASEDQVRGALMTAHRLRVAKNAKTARPARPIKTAMVVKSRPVKSTSTKAAKQARAKARKA